MSVKEILLWVSKSENSLKAKELAQSKSNLMEERGIDLVIMDATDNEIYPQIDVSEDIDGNLITTDNYKGLEEVKKYLESEDYE